MIDEETLARKLAAAGGMYLSTRGRDVDQWIAIARFVAEREKICRESLRYANEQIDKLRNEVITEDFRRKQAEASATEAERRLEAFAQELRREAEKYVHVFALTATRHDESIWAKPSAAARLRAIADRAASKEGK